MEDKISNRPLYTYASSLHLTFKAWPVIAAATIGLCYLTQTVAGWMGITLPDQANIEIVRRYAGWNRTFLFLCAQILVLLPALEELIFRYLLFRLPSKLIPHPSSLQQRFHPCCSPPPTTSPSPGRMPPSSRSSSSASPSVGSTARPNAFGASSSTTASSISPTSSCSSCFRRPDAGLPTTIYQLPSE